MCVCVYVGGRGGGGGGGNRTFKEAHYLMAVSKEKVLQSNVEHAGKWIGLFNQCQV